MDHRNSAKKNKKPQGAPCGQIYLKNITFPLIVASSNLMSSTHGKLVVTPVYDKLFTLRCQMGEL
jgi:hypothetical protein